MTPALAYLRTSSMTNVGEDKDSEVRQRASILRYALKNDIEIIAEYYDPGVRGTDPIHDRPGFARLLDHIAQNGVRLILVENASRFARDLMVQELGHAMLLRLGVSLIPVDDPDAFTVSTATGDLVRQILGAIAQFEKANLVAKLKSGRDRKRVLSGRCGGQQPPDSEAVTLAQTLRASGLSLRAVSAKLAEAGYYTYRKKGARRRRFGALSVNLMLRE